MKSDVYERAIPLDNERAPYLQNHLGKMRVHATHIVDAVSDLNITVRRFAGRNLLSV